MQNVQMNIRLLTSCCNNSVIGLMMNELVTNGKTRKYTALEKMSTYIEDKRKTALLGDFDSCKTILSKFPTVSDNLRQKYINSTMYKRFYRNPHQT